MNDKAARELQIIVERAVRPVRATLARKRRMREELLSLGILLEDTKDGVRWKRRQETVDRRQ